MAAAEAAVTMQPVIHRINKLWNSERFMLKIEFHAMGSQMAALLDSKSQQSIQAIEQTPGWFEEWEQVLSRFRPDNELSRLNTAGGLPVKVSPTLWAVLKAALQAARWSGGLIVPTVLNSLERAGYDRSFDDLQTSPTGLKLARISEKVLFKELTTPGDWEAIRMDAKEHSVTVPGGMRLDFGGIAKGWAAQQALKRLAVFGPALVDASGDIAISGLRQDNGPWSVGISDPFKLQEDLETLAMGKGAVATSGIDYHRWLQNGAWKHHIIDPRSGEPAETDLMSASVIAPDLLKAEAAAKAALILGSEAGLEWLENHYELEGLLARKDGRLTYTTGLQNYLWR
ncbi:MAG: FAD:protein FMN transferase [Anaerolineaceae bacterium]|nr:FAD:protein FMN transferase [Anaerolineaceae bacterium]